MPVDEFDGKVVYGEKRKTNTVIKKGHVDALAPCLKQLIDLEKKTQINFLEMKYKRKI